MSRQPRPKVVPLRVADADALAEQFEQMREMAASGKMRSGAFVGEDSDGDLTILLWPGDSPFALLGAVEMLRDEIAARIRGSQ